MIARAEAPFRALRIAHVLAPAPFGGLEHVVASLAVGQAQRGHNVHVIHVAEHADTMTSVGTPPASGVRTHVVRVRPRRYLAERAAVRSLARDIRVDVLHTHGYRPDVVDSGVAASLGAVRVTTVHGFTGGSFKNRLFETLQVRAFRRFDAVIAVSRPLRASLAGRGVRAERLHCIPNAWTAPQEATASREDARRTLGIPVAGTVIGWVGRLSSEKAPDVLIAALTRLREVPCRVAFVGDGREAARLRELASRLGVSDRVTWCGATQNAGRLFCAFDVFALTSRTEGTPIVLFEAMAAGVPIVATSVGGVPDVVSAREAWLVSPDSPDDVAAAVTQVLSDPPGRLSRTRAAHQRLATEFAADRWLDAYDEAYRVALSARQ